MPFTPQTTDTRHAEDDERNIIKRKIKIEGRRQRLAFFTKNFTKKRLAHTYDCKDFKMVSDINVRFNSYIDFDLLFNLEACNFNFVYC